MPDRSRKILIIDSMGRDLGAETSRRLAAPYAGRFATERVDARARPDWRAILGAVSGGEVAGILYTGSKAGVYEPDAWIRDLLGFTRDLVALEPPRPVPVLGICFGHQLLAEATAGPGAVEARPPAERGVREIAIAPEPAARACPIFEGLPARFRAVVTHQDHVLRVAPEFQVIASAEYTPNHAVRHRARPIFGVQSHPEACRPLMEIDEREYGHRNWAALDERALASADAPRMLESFARLVAAPG